MGTENKREEILEKNKKNVRQQLLEKHNKTLWSYSMFSTYLNSKYEYMLRYINRVPEDRVNVYSIMGGTIHELLEQSYKTDEPCQYLKDNIEVFDKEFQKAKMFGINFAKDEDRNDKIEHKYYNNIKSFLLNHNNLKDRFEYTKLKLEQFVVFKVGKEIFQGYIDVVLINEKGGRDKDEVILIDWKTSSKFSKKDLINKREQLMLYSLFYENLGYKRENIKMYFNMLKYVEIEYFLKDKITKKTTVKDRFDFSSGIINNLKTHLKNEKEETINEKGKKVKISTYAEEEIEDICANIIESNSLEAIPLAFRDLYKTKDYYLEIVIDSDDIDFMINRIEVIIDKINKDTKKYKETQDENIFWDTIDSSKAFYFATLCGYEPNTHKPYQQYLSAIDSIDATSKTDIGSLISDDNIFNDIFNHSLEEDKFNEDNKQKIIDINKSKEDEVDLAKQLGLI